MRFSESDKHERGITRSPSPHSKQEHVDHLIDEHGIGPLEGANRDRLRLLHGAAHLDLMGHKGEHLHSGDVAVVSMVEEGNLRATPPGP